MSRLRPTPISRHVPTFVSYNAIRAGLTQVLAINSDVRNACIAGDLRTAAIVLNQEIDTHANNYISYANRAFVMARESDWDHALHDAIKVIYLDQSWPPYENSLLW